MNARGALIGSLVRNPGIIAQDHLDLLARDIGSVSLNIELHVYAQMRP